MRSEERRFPGESEAYRKRRRELLRAEVELRSQIERVAEERRRLPSGGAVREDYLFDDSKGTAIRLSELFAPGKDTLVVYSYMFGPRMEKPCPMCTSIIDGLDATAPHARERVNLAVVAKSPIERLMEFVRGRGWKSVPLLSSHGNYYNRDYWAEDEEGNQWPMLNVFTRTAAGVRHFWGSELLYAGLEGEPRHVDLLWPLWNLFDLTPEGRGTGWYPKLSY